MSKSMLRNMVYGRRERAQPLHLDLPCLPAQEKLLRASGRIVAYVGGLGAGKTRAAVYKCLQLGSLSPGVPGLFVQPNYTLIRDSGIRSFEEILDELSIPYKINRTDYYIRVANIFDILLRSGEEADKIVATNAGWGVIDEPGKQRELVGKNVLARIRNPRSNLQQLVFTGTPEGKNWFYEWVKDLDDADLIKARTTDNPNLDPAYVESLKSRMSPEEIACYINGEFVSFDSGWFRIIPRVLPYRQDGSVKIFVEPELTSGDLVMGVDTSGGLGRDSTAIALIDKRDKKLVASYYDNRVTVDGAADIVEKMWNTYSRKSHEVYWRSFEREPSQVGPDILVEVNGIGLPMWQKLAAKGVPARQIKTSKALKYSFMLLTKNAVEAGYVEGPEELAAECEAVTTESDDFKGPKDLSMAIGFCLKEIESSPYKGIVTEDRTVFRMKLKSNKQVTV